MTKYNTAGESRLHLASSLLALFADSLPVCNEPESGIYDSLQRLDLRENSTLLEVCIGPGAARNADVLQHHSDDRGDAGVGLEEALRYQGVKVIGVDVSKVTSVDPRSSCDKQACEFQNLTAPCPRIWWN